MIGFWRWLAFFRFPSLIYPRDRTGWNWQTFQKIGIVRALCYWRRLLAIRIRGNRKAWFGCQRRSL